MGAGNWDKDTYVRIKTDASTKTQQQVFTATGLVPELDPKNLKFRESRDSVEHPASLATIIGLDVTGSMGRIPYTLVREKLGDLMELILEHGTADPQIMFMGLGDHYCDSVPLQVGQFESSTELIAKFLQNIYLEGGGARHYA